MGADPTVEIRRLCTLVDGVMHEDITVTSRAAHALRAALRLELGSDGVSIARVKYGALGLRADLPAGVLHVDPIRPTPFGALHVEGLRHGGVPFAVGALHVEGLRHGGVPFAVTVTREEEVEVTGVPQEVEIRPGA